jgi:hypothetical protein
MSLIKPAIIVLVDPVLAVMQQERCLFAFCVVVWKLVGNLGLAVTHNMNVVLMNAHGDAALDIDVARLFIICVFSMFSYYH